MRIFPSELMAFVAKQYNIGVTDLKGPHRFGHYVRARSILAKIWHDAGVSYPEIGRRLGGRDHSTIKRLFDHFPDHVMRDDFLAQVYEDALDFVGGNWTEMPKVPRLRIVNPPKSRRAPKPVDAPEPPRLRRRSSGYRFAMDGGEYTETELQILADMEMAA